MGTENATSDCFYENKNESVSDDIPSSCRLCMEHSKNMKNIFAPEHSTIVEKVEFCTGLQLRQEERLPSHICDACMHSLNLHYTFKTMCLTSDERFRKLAPVLKIENDEFDNDNGFDNFDEENDCKDVLKEVLKLNDIKISKVKLKKESIGPNRKLPQKKCQVKSNTTKSQPHKNKKSTPQTEKISWNCDVCNASFKSKEPLVEHKKSVHKGIESFVCEICGKVMQYRASLYTHMQSHQPPRHACDSCDYKTGHKHDLVKHRRIHSGVKQFQCEICTASYHTSSNLRAHARLSHEGAPKRFPCRLCEKHCVKQFQCEICTASYHTSSNLRAHARLSHEGAPKRFPCRLCENHCVKQFQCEICTASYHTSSNLRAHARLSHEGAPKRFPCRLCERSFFDRTKLRRHLDAHNDIKRYECEVCHSCFARRCYWKKHMLRQHGVAIPPARPGRQKTNLMLDAKALT